MNELLKIIVNTIISNLNNIRNNGLVNGKMGVCIFLYEYSRFSKCKLYQELADSLIDDIYNDSHDNMPTDIYDGYSGIGVGLSILMKKGFVKGNLDVVLKQIDELICHNSIHILKNDLNLYNTICSSGVYFIHRFQKECVSLQRKRISTILDIILDNLAVERRNYDSNNIQLFEQSICCVLKKFQLENVFRDRIKNSKNYEYIENYVNDINDIEDIIERKASSLWWSYLHDEKLNDIDDLKDYIYKELDLYPYIMDKINSHFVIYGLTILKKQFVYERIKNV